MHLFTGMYLGQRPSPLKGLPVPRQALVFDQAN